MTTALISKSVGHYLKRELQNSIVKFAAVPMDLLASSFNTGRLRKYTASTQSGVQPFLSLWKYCSN